MTWRDREAAMWSICSVARVFVQQQRQSIDQMKSSQKSQTGAVEPPTQIETEHCNQSSLILSQLLIGIASNPQAFSHPLLVRAVASTMEALASWIDSVAEAHPQIVQAVATYLVTSLRIPGVSSFSSACSHSCCIASTNDILFLECFINNEFINRRALLLTCFGY